MIVEEAEAKVRKQVGAEGPVEAHRYALVLHLVSTAGVTDTKAFATCSTERRCAEEPEIRVVIATEGVDSRSYLIVKARVGEIAIIIARSGGDVIVGGRARSTRIRLGKCAQQSAALRRDPRV